ncbi:MAG: adenylyl cyclase [Alphaproteobacteria bacterium]|nr:adenylyl cyclase [Alphaproteobacteria bacterium]
MPIEYEAKFLDIDKDEFRGKLTAAGYECTMPEFMFRRQTFDFPIFDAHKWGRVRWEKDAITLSIKHIVDKTRIDGTHEFMLTLPLGEDPARQYADALAFMQAAGLSKSGEQENKREIWTKNQVEICLDTWPGLSPFMEIEGPDEASVRTATTEMGLDFNNAMFGGIDSVYDAVLGIPVEEFVRIKRVTFAEPPLSFANEVSKGPWAFGLKVE